MVGEYLADESDLLKEDSDTKESEANKLNGGLGMANPFQTKEVTRLDLGGEIRNATTSDTDWLVEEWENSQNGAATDLETVQTMDAEAALADFAAENPLSTYCKGRLAVRE